VALAPDLYHGELATEPDEARKLAMALERERAVAEILGAARYLQSLEEVAPKQIGVVGFCMGGGLAASAAAESDGELGAAVMFYGRPLDPNDTAKLQVPLLGLFGELDQGIPVEGVRAFAEELEAHGKTHEIHIYPDAQHAFFNDGRSHMYHPKPPPMPGRKRWPGLSDTWCNLMLTSHTGLKNAHHQNGSGVMVWLQPILLFPKK
jgi:carboxymethylenebutenolidase